MAQDVINQDQELQEAGLESSDDSDQNNKPDLQVIKIREPFEIGGTQHIIYDIGINGGIKRTFGWKIREGSKVEISGSGLGLFNQIILNIAGGVYIQKAIERTHDGRIIRFEVNQEIKDLYKEGQQIELEFVDINNSQNNRYLKQKFKYGDKSDEEKKQEQIAKAKADEEVRQKTGSVEREGLTEILNQVIGGVPEAFAQGLKGGAKATGLAGTAQASSVGAKIVDQTGGEDESGGGVSEDFGFDEGMVVEEGAESAEGGLTTKVSSVGEQVISQGGTVEQSLVGAKTISSGGTATTTQTVSASGTAGVTQTVFGGGTANIPQQVQTGGTTKTTIKSQQTVGGGSQTVSAGGTVSGGGTSEVTQKVSASGTSTARQTVSAGGTASASQQVETGGTVSGGGISTAGVASGTAEVSKDATTAGSQQSQTGGTVSGTQKTQSQASASQSQQASSQEEVSEKTKVTAEEKTEAKAQSEILGEDKINIQEKPQVQVPESGTPKVESPSGVKQTIKQEIKPQQSPPKSAENKKPLPGKGKVDGVEQSPEPKTESEPATEKKSVPQTQKKAPTSTAGFGGGFSASGGTLGQPLGGLSGTLDKFKANEAALGGRLGSKIGKASATQKVPGLAPNVLGNAPKKSSGEKDKEKDAGQNKSAGESSEKQEEKPLGSPLGKPAGQDGEGAGGAADSQNPENASQPDSSAQEKKKQGENEEETGEQEPSESEPEAGDQSDGGAGKSPPSMVQKPTAPASLSTAELAEAEKLANATVNTFLQSLATVIWASALPTFGLSILFGAVAGDILWLLKDWAIKRALSKVPLPKKFRVANVKDFHIKFSLSIKSQIAAWNAIIVAVVFLIFIFIFTMLWAICTSYITYPIRQSGLAPVCEIVEKSTLGQSMNNLRSSGSFSGSYNVPGGLTSTAQWTDQINSSAQKWNIDACILRVVVQKESSGKEQVIGCDCAANGHPEYCPDKRKNYSSDYQFNWAQCSYGIGLTQWTIYPKGGSGYKAWQDINTPSRNLYSTWYGVTDFLDGKTSLDLTAKAFSANLAKANGDVASAFGTYVGSSNVQSQLVADRMALYNMCKNGN